MTALRIRSATDSDLEFVVAAWVESYRMSHFSGPIPMPLYRSHMTEYVRWMLARPGIEVLVAHKPGESPPDDVYGWLCMENDMPMRVRRFDHQRGMTVEDELVSAQPIVHYVYVKQLFREHGIANRLFQFAEIDPRAGLVHTHKTAIVAKLQGLKKLPGATFAPQLARFPKNEPKEKPDVV